MNDERENVLSSYEGDKYYVTKPFSTNPLTKFWFWTLMIVLLGLLLTIILFETVEQSEWVWIIFGISVLLLIVSVILYFYDIDKCRGSSTTIRGPYDSCTTCPPKGCNIVPRENVLQPLSTPIVPSFNNDSYIVAPEPSFVPIANPTVSYTRSPIEVRNTSVSNILEEGPIPRAFSPLPTVEDTNTFVNTMREEPLWLKNNYNDMGM